MSFFAKVAEIDGHTVTPPPEEPQTAAPESPTESGHRTMSTAHPGYLLASEQQQTGDNRERCSWMSFFAKVAEIDGHTVTPPPEESQTAAPESPTVSGHRTMSTTHAG